MNGTLFSITMTDRISANRPGENTVHVVCFVTGFEMKLLNKLMYFVNFYKAIYEFQVRLNEDSVVKLINFCSYLFFSH